MLAPMGVYLALQMTPGGVAAGWAIPMATDIAFAMVGL
jgi:NhaA family Na+:H+ antiporter